MSIVYLSLGSNIGDREAQLRSAIARLQNLGKVLAVSSFYETEPVDVVDQSWFLNCAVAIETTLSPGPLLGVMMHIEQHMGRRRTVKKGPRTIDIDILLFDDAVIGDPDLIVPHPAMHQRRFVLEPLAEIASQARHPLLGKTVHELLADLPAGQVVKRLPKQ
ncbi:MAG TPA: 2-amino-4-hydroxy-6-hydroxymethyldihydropteridine diphosphokinase [Candidatus Solibacter sp.]|nr:2-amino-4-hydroxy-6-hydroxymethyldihydropteridine diphosphokinase [Candidatus Solibacter sp.]